MMENSIKIKLKKILENNRLINLILKTTYCNNYENIKSFLEKNPNAKEDKELIKMHWIFNFIDSDNFRFELFANNKQNKILDDDKLILILESIIRSEAIYQDLNSKKAYKDSDTNLKKHINNDIKIISDFENLISSKYELKGNISISSRFTEKREILNIGSLCNFLNGLQNELKSLNGNNKKSLDDFNNLGLFSVYYKHSNHSLLSLLRKNLKSYSECSKDNFELSIQNILEFQKKIII